MNRPTNPPTSCTLVTPAAFPWITFDTAAATFGSGAPAGGTTLAAVAGWVLAIAPRAPGAVSPDGSVAGAAPVTATAGPLVGTAAAAAVVGEPPGPAGLPPA